MSVIEEIAAERRRQIEVEGFTLEHDDAHRHGEMARAAAAYALATTWDDRFRDGCNRAAPGNIVISDWAGPVHAAHNPVLCAWPHGWGAIKLRDRRHDLIRAAALLVAEIERLDRGAATGESDHG